MTSALCHRPGRVLNRELHHRVSLEDELDMEEGTYSKHNHVRVCNFPIPAPVTVQVLMRLLPRGDLLPLSRFTIQETYRVDTSSVLCSIHWPK